jgi:hypothetical protein
MTTAEKAFADNNPGMTVFARGQPGAAVMLAVAPHRMVVKISGTALSENLVALLEQAHDHLGGDEFCALIDLAGFTGVIDWDEVKKISDVMPKGTSRTNRNAYLVRDSYLAMVAKITAALFPLTECAAFTNESEARRWLGWG